MSQLVTKFLQFQKLIQQYKRYQMGRGSSQSNSQSRKQKKVKKEKKEKKDKKQKKQKKQKQKHKHKHERHSNQKQQKREIAEQQQQKLVIKPVFLHKKEQQQGQFSGQPRTHIPCRRCKQMTFSLKTRSCSACGYPKQQRPAYFPVQKEQNVYDMIRDGKLVHNSYAPVLIEVIVNDRFGKKQRIKCSPIDKVLDLKKLISAQIGTRPEKIRLQKANIIYKDHISLQDYQIKDGSGLQMYYD